MKNKMIKIFSTFLLLMLLVFVPFGCGKGSDEPSAPEVPSEPTPVTTYQVNLPSVDGGSITSSASSVEAGGSVELTVVPEEFYELVSLKVNDKTVTVTNNKATISNVQSDLDVTASFIGVEVEITFILEGEVYSTTTGRYNEKYDKLPVPKVAPNQQFVGWYTEPDGQGSLIDSNSLINSGNAYSLYAYVTKTSLTVSVDGIPNRLVHLPNEDAETAVVDVFVFVAGEDVTSEFTIEVVSSNTNVVVVDGMTLKIADNADGYTDIIIKVDGVEYKRLVVNATDYAGLGYKTVASVGDFKTMNGNSKYVLIDDINLNGWLAKADYSPLIDTLSKDAVIDGNGHFVYDAKLAGGWNNGWIKNVEGTVRNIAFVDLTTADSNPFSTGLFGTLKDGAVLDNIYVDATIPCDGQYDAANKSGGVLVGTLEGGTISNVIINANVKKGVSLEAYGAFAGIVKANNAKVYNSYAFINNNYLREFGNEYKYNSWFGAVQDDSGVVYNSVNTFICDKILDHNFNSIWTIAESDIYFNKHVILSVEAEYSIAIEESYTFKLDQDEYSIDFVVYHFGEETKDYVLSDFVSTNEEVFTVDENGNLNIVGAGNATLSFKYNGISVQTDIIVNPEYYLITTVEEFRTLLTADPNGKFKLGNNIDFKGEYFAGSDATLLVATFSGEFDGCGYAILNAKLPGGWNGHALFNINTGTVKNVAFLNLVGPTINTNTGIIGDNKGLIENVYVDFVINSDGREYGFAGVISGFSGIGVTRNCMTNIRLDKSLEVAPKFFGSIIGNANAWAGSMPNCYSIVHDTGVVDIASMEGESGILKGFKDEGSKQFQTYTQFKLEADVSMYDSSIWTFEDDQIVFGHNVVYTLQEDDAYVYIDSADKFLSEIQKNPAGKFRLAKDIDFKNKSITFNENNVVFSGVLDGMGHIISNAVMNQSNIFVENTGVVCNIAFVNLLGPTNCDKAGLVLENKGTIDNIFVDFIVRHDGLPSDYAGVVAANATQGTISNVIVNLELNTGLKNAPDFMGSLVGLVSENSIIKNSYAIVNNINFVDFAFEETSDGAIASLRGKTANQYNLYSEIKLAGETFESFNSKYWAFTNAEIKYNGSIVVIDKTQDEYIYISTVAEWKTLITADPKGKFKLANDLDFQGDWITTKDSTVIADKFTGVLDGQGYQIKNAKMPGGWAGHAIFNYNEGEIRNIAFVNIIASKVSTQNSLFNVNRGIIENIYVDYVLQTPTYTSDYNGVIATFTDNHLSSDKPSIIRNCIVNVRLADGATLPPCQGSIVGKAGGWTGYVYNCYAIINDTGITDVCYHPNGNVAASTCSTSAQFETYAMLKAGADVSMYDQEIWNFTDTTINFFGRVVYSVS